MTNVSIAVRPAAIQKLSDRLLAGDTAGEVEMMAWFPDSCTSRDDQRDGGPALAPRAAVNLIRECIIRR